MLPTLCAAPYEMAGALYVREAAVFSSDDGPSEGSPDGHRGEQRHVEGHLGASSLLAAVQPSAKLLICQAVGSGHRSGELALLFSELAGWVVQTIRCKFEVPAA